MYNEQLEALIDAALADGVLTEKERSILLNKAEDMGVDADEFEMVLEGRLHKKQQEMKKEQAQAPAKSNKYGEVRKCPSCGAPAKSFQTSCSECGTEFHNIGAGSGVAEKFADEIRKIDAQIADEAMQLGYIFEHDRGESKIGCSTILLWLFFWPFMLIYHVCKLLLSTMSGEKLTPRQEQKKNFITTFAIPTNKEDMLELLILMHSNVVELSNQEILSKKGRLGNTWNKIWLQKMSYIHDKAVIAMANDKAGLAKVEEFYGLAETRYKKNLKKITILSIVGGVLLVAFIVFLLLIGNH